MKFPIAMGVVALLLTSACQNPATNTSSEVAPSELGQSEAEIVECLRAYMKLDEGKWAYMGTIARGNGMFRTYETTSEHAAAGQDMWSARSYGGDVEDSEETAELGYIKLVGTSFIPLEDGELDPEGAVNYTSCTGPDAEGRYQATQEYTLPHIDDRRLDVKSVVWRSEHGSYYAEDIFDDTGRVLARRSGVYTPIEE